MLTSRDLASKYYAATSGAFLRYRKGLDDLLLSFFTGSRSNGIGFLKDGQIDIGVGRNTLNDDHKGLPDGTSDDQLYEISFSLGLFKTNEINTLEYKKYFDKEENPILVNKRDDFHLKQESWG